MADETYTDAQALSVLNKLEDELKLFEAQRGGLKQIRMVILKYMDAKTVLDGFETEKKRLEDAIIGLKPQFETELKRFVAQHQGHKASYLKELEDLRARLEGAREETKKIETDLGEKQRFANTRSSQMDADIRATSATLEALKADVAALKKRHGVA